MLREILNNAPGRVLHLKQIRGTIDHKYSDIKELKNRSTNLRARLCVTRGIITRDMLVYALHPVSCSLSQSNVQEIFFETLSIRRLKIRSGMLSGGGVLSLEGMCCERTSLIIRRS